MSKTKVVVTSLVVVAALAGAGIWGAVWFSSEDSSELNYIPAYGTPLQSDNSAANPDNVLLDSNVFGTRTEDFKQYEKYAKETQILLGEIQKGTGAEAVKDKQVAIAYKGYLTSGKMFDQTTDKALGFTLGQQGIIPGMQMGVAGMKVGGKRRIIIPPSLGYGNNSHGPIPANSVLIFDVELLQVK